LTSVGLASVLLVLVIVALWGALSTYRVANSARRLSELSDAFEQASFAVAAEESLNRKYRLEPSAEVLKLHREAAALLLTALSRVRALDDSADGVLIGDVLGIHKEYLVSIGRMFAAVDAGDLVRANELDRTEVDPRFDKMEVQISAAAGAHHAAAEQRLDELAYVQTGVLAMIICAFAIGMGLVVLYEYSLRAQWRRADVAKALAAITVRLREDRHRMLARHQYEQFNAALDNMPLGFCMVDDEQKLVVTNKRFAEIYRLQPDMILPGTPLRTSLVYRAANGDFGDDIGPDFVEEALAAARAPERRGRRNRRSTQEA
jgi:PAS domain-containing protein